MNRSALSGPLPTSTSLVPPSLARRQALRRMVGGAMGVSAGLALTLVLATPEPAQAAGAPIELMRLDGHRTEQGVSLETEVRFDLPPGVEDALQKGVALNFVAEAEVLRSRWYWRDQRMARAVRTWRLSYQPLTFTYKVSFGGLSQTYRSLAEALRVIQRAPPWRVGDAVPDDDSRYYLEYSFKLDTNQLPRPLLIGVSGQAEWNLAVERTVPLQEGR